MRTNLLPLVGAVLTLVSASALATTHYVDLNSANPQSPFSDWSTAATNIQDAINAASVHDVVWVTNGVYASGGKSLDGVLTNRVSVDKAILVQSVNGPEATIIQGAWDPAIVGPTAARCVSLAANATLSGFTLRGGATRPYGASPSSSQMGGGVYGVSSSVLPIVTNCTIMNNAAGSHGGGAQFVTLINCRILHNTVLGLPGYSASGVGGGATSCNLTNCVVSGNYALSSGGGTYYGFLKNCAVTGNSAGDYAGGVDHGTLVNCTVTANSVLGTSFRNGGGAYQAVLTNCIVYGNREAYGGSTSNYAGCIFGYSCSSPLPFGGGNLGADPLLLADGIHLDMNSPCRGIGRASAATGTDIDGQPWVSPPSMGCDEWLAAPVLTTPPNCQIGSPPRGLSLSLTVAGQAPFACSWTKDGAPLTDDGHYGNSATPNLVISNFGPDDAGLYQAVVSNAVGVATSQVSRVVIHVVDAAGTNPVAPFSSWATAATTIQDAINVAAAGDIVLVADGIYASAGKVMVGDLTNRVALDKPLTVISANGSGAAVIQGAWDAAGNGPGAVRCAWLTDGAVLNGFTLRNGATRSSGDITNLQSGGGAFCISAKGLVSNCILTNNRAIYGGGINQGTLNNSLVVGNSASYGGGVSQATACNSFLESNHASRYGGGAYYATLNNCTVVYNYVAIYGGSAGAYYGTALNSIVLYNYADASSIEDDFFPFTVHSYCCTAGSSMGTSDFTAAPQFLDPFHLAATSPCRGAGNAYYASGTDLDGEAWVNPPSVGCDEVVLSNLVGSLSVNIVARDGDPFVGHSGWFQSILGARATALTWDFGDGSGATNNPLVGHTWTSPGDFTVTVTAFNTDHPAGVSTNLVVHVSVPNPPQLVAAPQVVGNNFVFQFTGQSNAAFTVQYATNLAPPVTWQTLQSFYFSAGQVYQIADPATNGTRYYRVVAH
jgi:hypothetical protein